MTFLLRLLFLVFIFYLVRHLVKVLAPGLVSHPGTSPPDRGNTGTMVKHGTMEKDPVCGTYVDVATSLKLISGGETRHFCSGECRDKFQREARP